MQTSGRKGIGAIVWIMMSIVLMISLTSCGEEKNTVRVDYTVNELMAKVFEGLDLGYQYAPDQIIKVQDPEEGFYFTGIKDGASLVEEDAVFRTPMMGQAFQVVIVKLRDVKDAETVKEEMRDGSDLGRWICRRADQLIVTSNDKYIICVMGSREETEQVVDSFDKVFQGGSTDRLTKN